MYVYIYIYVLHVCIYIYSLNEAHPLNSKIPPRGESLGRMDRVESSRIEYPNISKFIMKYPISDFEYYYL